jgi:hypothetical protein
MEPPAPGLRTSSGAPGTATAGSPTLEVLK